MNRFEHPQADQYIVLAQDRHRALHVAAHNERLARLARGEQATLRRVRVWLGRSLVGVGSRLLHGLEESYPQRPLSVSR